MQILSFVSVVQYGCWSREWKRSRVFSCDVTAAMLVSLNKEMVAMMVYQTNPPGNELYFYANTFFCFSSPIWLLVREWKRSRVFSRDVTAAMLVSLNNGTAMLVSQNPRGIEFYHHAKVIRWKNKVTDHMSETLFLATWLSTRICYFLVKVNDAAYLYLRTGV